MCRIFYFVRRSAVDRNLDDYTFFWTIHLVRGRNGNILLSEGKQTVHININHWIVVILRVEFTYNPMYIHFLRVQSSITIIIIEKMPTRRNYVLRWIQWSVLHTLSISSSPQRGMDMVDNKAGHQLLMATICSNQQGNVGHHTDYHKHHGENEHVHPFAGSIEVDLEKQVIQRVIMLCILL